MSQTISNGNVVKLDNEPKNKGFVSFCIFLILFFILPDAKNKFGYFLMFYSLIEQIQLNEHNLAHWK